MKILTEAIKETIDSQLFLYMMAAYGIVSMFWHFVLALTESVMFFRKKRKNQRNEGNPTSNQGKL